MTDIILKREGAYISYCLTLPSHAKCWSVPTPHSPEIFC